ncbi:MAG: phosphatase PAP2 family protein [Bacilli bacterium]|nr:phosphatase PAP2 family protein [Bacilli bacterium]
MKRRLFDIPSWWFYALFALAIIGIFFGSIFDLSLSKALADLESPLGNFFETFGLFPAYFFMEAIAVTLFVSLYKREKALLRAIGYIALIIATLYLIYNWSSFFYLDPKSGINLYGIRFESRFLSITIPALLLLPSGAAVYFLLDKSKEKADFMLLLSLTMAVALALRLGTSYLLKDLAGRPRYRFLYYVGEFEGGRYSFASWWEFSFFKNPHNDYFRSWPSGHTLSAALTFFLVCFPRISKKRFRDDSYIYFFFALIYTFIMMLFRIRVGAHYLSDVSMGLLLSLIFVYLSLYFIDQITLKAE